MDDYSARILNCIFVAIDELCAADSSRTIDKRPETMLLGPGSQIDSLALVTLIVLVEQKVSKEFGCAFSLANEKAMSQTRSPFSTIETLSLYIQQVLKETAV